MVNKRLCECGCGKPTTIITHTQNKIGKVQGDYNRFLPHHHMNGKPKPKVQRGKMSEARKGWYKNNPEKAKLKAEKVSKTKIKEGTHKGKKNVNWHGGISMKPKKYNYNPKLKASIKERDEYQCKICFKYQSGLNYNLGVHHIDYNKRNDNPNNLITLCKSCHSKTSFNRGGWIEYFTNFMINERRYKETMTKKVLLKTDLPRETGKLYYVGTDKKTGNLTLCSTDMARGGRKKKKTTKKKDSKK